MSGYDRVLEGSMREQAARIEAQAKRIAELEAALRTVWEWHGYGLPGETVSVIKAALFPGKAIS